MTRCLIKKGVAKEYKTDKKNTAGNTGNYTPDSLVCDSGQMACTIRNTCFSSG